YPPGTRARVVYGPLGSNHAGPAGDRILGDLRLGHREPEPARLRGTGRPARITHQRSTKLAIGLPAPDLSEHAFAHQRLPHSQLETGIAEVVRGCAADARPARPPGSDPQAQPSG